MMKSKFIFPSLYLLFCLLIVTGKAYATLAPIAIQTPKNSKSAAPESEQKKETSKEKTEKKGVKEKKEKIEKNKKKKETSNEKAEKKGKKEKKGKTEKNKKKKEISKSEKKTLPKEKKKKVAKSDNISPQKIKKSNEKAATDNSSLDKVAIVGTQFHYRLSANITFPQGIDVNAGIGGGFTTGFGATIPFSKKQNKWSFQPELMIGIHTLPNINIKNPETRTKISFYTIHIPLLFKIQLTEPLHLYAGPTLFSILDVTQNQITLAGAINHFNVGATGGLEFYLNKKIAVDLRYNYNVFALYNEHNVMAPLKYTLIYPQNIEIGFIYKFKRTPKAIVVHNKSENLYRDGDILNLSKALDPEDDSDGDGVPYYKDACPNEPGSAWNNGCPPDTDRDGVPDDKDSCITIPGIVKNDGCPINDKDKDGIIDLYDKCPNERGPLSNKGCPIIATPTETVKVDGSTKPTAPEPKNDFLTYEQNRILEKAMEQIQFETGSDKLKKVSLTIIKELSKMVIANQELTLNIQALTSGLKDTKKNIATSEKRLKILKKEFLYNRVPKKQIETRASEASETGKTKQSRNTPKTNIVLNFERNGETLKKAETDTPSNVPVTPVTTATPLPNKEGDSTKVAINIRDERIRILTEKASKNINFKDGKNTFLNANSAQKVLKEIQNLLGEYNNLKLSVKIVYASKGIVAKELSKLSTVARERGEKVKQELIKLGVATDTITTTTEAVEKLTDKKGKTITNKEATQTILAFQ